jgi:hypothetical protein
VPVASTYQRLPSPEGQRCIKAVLATFVFAFRPAWAARSDLYCRAQERL